MRLLNKGSRKLKIGTREDTPEATNYMYFGLGWNQTIIFSKHIKYFKKCEAELTKTTYWLRSSLASTEAKVTSFKTVILKEIDLVQEVIENHDKGNKTSRKA